jgi:hypothetical protein
MDFNSALQTKMRDINDGSTEPFIVYRDKDGGWHCDHTQNQYGETFDWVDDVSEKDPLSLIYTGKDFSMASFPSVCDKILYDRLRSEYYIERSSGRDTDNLNAITCFIQDNISALSNDVTSYLTTLEHPLDSLADMCPDMTTNYEGWSYNEAIADDAVTRIEGAVKDRLHIPDQGGYTELNKISINDSDIILSENPNAEYRYMVVENRFTEYYNNTGDNNIFTGHTNDYLEAIEVFTEKVQYNAECVQSRRNSLKHFNDVDFVELKNSDCLPGSDDKDFTGKLIIVKASELKPEYRSAENQLVLCTHGNGARPNAKGTSVFAKELLTGESVCFGRHQIAGIADPDKLPKWAMDKIAIMEAEKTPQKSKAPETKPSLLGRLDNAKAEAAAQNMERKDANKTKKHGLEV